MKRGQDVLWGQRKKPLTHAWRCRGIRCASRQQERPQPGTICANQSKNTGFWIGGRHRRQPATARLSPFLRVPLPSLPRYFCRPRRGWRNRTPSPVPFSSMKSTPANSSACFRTARVACRGPVAPPSNCRIVATPIWAASASSCWVQSRRPLAALHCEAVSMALRTKATDSRQFDCFSIDIATNCFYIETTFNDTLEASDVG